MTADDIKEIDEIFDHITRQENLLDEMASELAEVERYLRILRVTFPNLNRVLGEYQQLISN